MKNDVRHEVNRAARKPSESRDFNISRAKYSRVYVISEVRKPGVGVKLAEETF